jgi:hypothetical protein
LETRLETIARQGVHLLDGSVEIGSVRRIYPACAVSATACRPNDCQASPREAIMLASARDTHLDRLGTGQLQAADFLRFLAFQP